MSKSVVINRRRVVVVVVVVGGRLSCRQILKRTRILDKYSDETFMMAGALPAKTRKKKRISEISELTRPTSSSQLFRDTHTQVDPLFETKQFVGGWNKENGITHKDVVVELDWTAKVC